MTTDWVGPRAVKIGILSGALTNLCLFLLQWWWQVISISWLWWNVTGFLSSVLVAGTLAGWEKAVTYQLRLEPMEPSRIRWTRVYALVGLYFVLMIGAAAWIGGVDG